MSIETGKPALRRSIKGLRIENNRMRGKLSRAEGLRTRTLANAQARREADIKVLAAVIGEKELVIRELTAEAARLRRAIALDEDPSLTTKA